MLFLNQEFNRSLGAYCQSVLVPQSNLALTGTSEGNGVVWRTTDGELIIKGAINQRQIVVQVFCTLIPFYGLSSIYTCSSKNRSLSFALSLTFSCAFSVQTLLSSLYHLMSPIKIILVIVK